VKKKLLDHHRKKLKRPVGTLVHEKNAFQQKQNEKIVVVGDQCLFQALSQKKEPHVGVYDHKTKRKATQEETQKKIREWKVRKETVKNEPGTISMEAIQKIKQVMKNNEKTKIEVDGEEDLLVLPFILHSENGTRIYYGQPEEGIVHVEVSPELKRKVKQMLEEMPLES
jgi:hypothetical protein